MSKIGNLEVETININHGAVSGLATANTSSAVPSLDVIVPNSEDLPVHFIFSGVCYATHSRSGHRSYSVGSVGRTRGAVTLYSQSYPELTASSGTRTFTYFGNIIDMTAEAGDTYTLYTVVYDVSPDPTPPQILVSYGYKFITGSYVKR